MRGCALLVVLVQHASSLSYDNPAGFVTEALKAKNRTQREREGGREGGAKQICGGGKQGEERREEERHYLHLLRHYYKSTLRPRHGDHRCYVTGRLRRRRRHPHR